MWKRTYMFNMQLEYNIVLYCVGWMLLVAGHQAFNVTKDCGTLLYRVPTMTNRDVHFQFIPQRDKPGGSATWKICGMFTLVWCNKITDPRYRRASDVDGTIFNMTMMASAEDNGHNFMVEYEYDGNTCESIEIELNLKELPRCGYMYIRTPLVVDKQDTDIVFIPGPEFNPDHYSWATGKLGSPYAKITPRNDGVYSETYDRIYDEYIITVHTITTRQGGWYTVQCSAVSPVINAKEVEVRVLEPPSEVSLHPLSNITNCSQCVVGALNSIMRMRCVVRGGTMPIVAKMHTGNQRQSIRASSREFLSMFEPTEDLHGKQVKCTVTNPALVKSGPMVVSATMYVTVAPSPPQLSIGILKEGHSAGISCTSTGGRPAPDIALTLGNPRLSLPISSVIDDTGVERHVLRMSRNLSRADNGNEMRCCVKHPALVKALCTTKRLNVKFPPAVLELEKPQFPREDSHYYTVFLTCISVQSNPGCNIHWNADIPLKTTFNFISSNEFGYNVTNKIEVNVTRHVTGQAVTCTVSCVDFPDISLMKTHMIQVPYSPIVSLNVSNTTPLDLSTGDSIVIQCSVQSFPPSTVIWREENGTEVTGSRCGAEMACLSFTAIQPADAGVYSCEARNSRYNTTWKEVHLRVKEPTVPLKTAISGADGDNAGDAGNGSTLWLPILVAALVVVAATSGAIAVILIIMSRRRMRNRKDARPQQNDLPLDNMQSQAAALPYDRLTTTRVTTSAMYDELDITGAGIVSDTTRGGSVAGPYGNLEPSQGENAPFYEELRPRDLPEIPTRQAVKNEREISGDEELERLKREVAQAKDTTRRLKLEQEKERLRAELEQRNEEVAQLMNRDDRVMEYENLKIK